MSHYTSHDAPYYRRLAQRCAERAHTWRRDRGLFGVHPFPEMLIARSKYYLYLATRSDAGMAPISMRSWVDLADQVIAVVDDTGLAPVAPSPGVKGDGS